MKLYDMSDEPERKTFLDKLIAYQEERGTPISQCPTISKSPLDLYRLYLAVKERGGFVEVSRAKLWKECTVICNIATSSSAAYTLRKQYIKHLFPFECKFDRGGVDPQPILASLDTSNRKNKKNAVAAAAAAAAAVPPPEQSFQGHTGPPSIDGYGPPGSYPPQPPFPPPNSMPNSEYSPQQQSNLPSGYPSGPPPPMSGPPPHMRDPNSSSMPNHESVSVKDPFSDEMQHGPAYPPRSHSQPPTQPPSGPQSQTGPTSQQPNEYNSKLNRGSNTSGYNSNFHLVANQANTQPAQPPPQNHYGEYNDGFNRSTAQTDPYGAPPSQSQGYPPTRMSHPSPYYNQQQAYDSHRTDTRFEGHSRPSQDSMYGQQPPTQPPVPAGGHPPRGQYPVAPPSSQPSVPIPPNTPPSASNYSRGGASPLGQYGAMGQQINYSNSSQDNFKSNDYQVCSRLSILSKC